MKRVLISILVVLMAVFLFNSCKKKVKTEPQPVKVEKVAEEAPKINKPQLTEEEIFQKKSLEEINKEGYLKRINFDFDKYSIREDMKSILHSNADWLLKHTSVVINIEGHCDERGTVEYNMALGEKRAQAAKNYLTSLGVKESAISVISYGKSKPLVKGVDENTYYQNRRDEFVIIKK